MSLANFNLQRFQAFVKTKGLARTNRFEIMLVPPSVMNRYGRQYDEISLACELTTLPPLNVDVRELKIYGPTYKRPTGLNYGGEGLPITFHLDRDMSFKRLIEDWIHMMVSRGSHIVNYSEDVMFGVGSYYTRVYLRQLDEANNVTYEIFLNEAFPRSMNIVELNNTAQNQTHRMTVIFAFRTWERQFNNKTLETIEVSTQPIPTVETNPVSVQNQSDRVDPWKYPPTL